LFLPLNRKPARESGIGAWVCQPESPLTKLGRSFLEQGEFHMEPKRNESARPESKPERKRKEKSRFQIVKLEERIAPKIGGGGHHHSGDICRDSARCYPGY
jgi:hypothetical protein